jgi:hypothetical protein
MCSLSIQLGAKVVGRDSFHAQFITCKENTAQAKCTTGTQNSNMSETLNKLL